MLCPAQPRYCKALSQLRSSAQAGPTEQRLPHAVTTDQRPKRKTPRDKTTTGQPPPEKKRKRKARKIPPLPILITSAPNKGQLSQKTTPPFLSLLPPVSSLPPTRPNVAAPRAPRLHRPLRRRRAADAGLLLVVVLLAGAAPHAPPRPAGLRDVAAALSLGPLPVPAAAGGSAKRAFPDPSPRAGAAKGAPRRAAGRQVRRRLDFAQEWPIWPGTGRRRAEPTLMRAQVVGWPPVRNYRKNTLAASATKSKAQAEEAASGGGPIYVKVSMDGAPYLRKVDVKMYSSYEELSTALEKMFSCFITGE
ncbi:hypothetical protein HU200_047210 [Digitaria exilis]|uniref:Auxin-responsive protein n=1 Tax=Digitaria exilis TaxID=1010633 RepID=A0A835EDS4_9POAL|nr:hypothetical protein HU200_047210 [Digitaria exilis]